MYRSAYPLSIEQIARTAPSVLASKAHDSRSDRYAYIPTMEIIDGMRREGFEVYAVGQNRTRSAEKREFTKHVVRMRHISMATPKVGDSIPEIILTNSHDGSSGYQLSSGFFRLVCSNGMVVGNATNDISVRHSGNVMDNVIEGATRVLDDLQLGMERIQEFQDIQLNRDEQVLLASSALQLRYDGAAPLQSSSLLTVRRWDDKKDDLWTVFNRIQENVIKGGLRARTANGRRTSTRAVTGVTEDLKLNKALWSLADGMAQLKNGLVAA